MAGKPYRIYVFFFIVTSLELNTRRSMLIVRSTSIHDTHKNNFLGMKTKAYVYVEKKSNKNQVKIQKPQISLSRLKLDNQQSSIKRTFQSSVYRLIKTKMPKWSLYTYRGTVSTKLNNHFEEWVKESKRMFRWDEDMY